MNITKNVIVAYHENCTDGFTSAFIASEALNKLGYNVVAIAVNYTEESLNNLVVEAATIKPDEIYIVDFSIPVKMITELNEYITDNIIILDHHKTAFENYCGKNYVVKPDSYEERNIEGAEIYLDNAKSGAGLCWSFFNSDDKPVPNLVKYVQDYDLWKYEFGVRTKHINKYLGSQAKGFANWRSIMKDMEDSAKLTSILMIGKNLQQVHDTRVADISAGAITYIIDSIEGLAVKCRKKEFVSDIGHTLCKRSGTFGAIYSIDEDAQQVAYSLRSEGDFDVSAIAKRFGGGGHKNAAGFTVSLSDHRAMLDYNQQRNIERINAEADASESESTNNLNR